MIKKMNLLFIFIPLFFLFTGCNKSFYNEYKDAYLLEEDNIYIEISLEQVYEKMENKENFILYYGQTSCSACYASVGTFDLNAKEAGISTIYYLKSKILNLGGDDKRVDEMQANIGFDEDNSPQSTPRLWCFIGGEYKTGMASFLTEEDQTWDNPSKLLFAYYIENTNIE